MQKKRRLTNINLNVKLTMGIVGLFFLIIIIRLCFIVISNNVDGIDLREFADNRNTTKQTLYANRGIIYDRDGIPLAKNANSYKIIAILSPTRTTDAKNPYHVVDKDKTTKSLCSVLATDEKDKATCEKEVKNYLSQDLYQVELGNWGKIGEDEKRAIENLDLPGIEFETLSKKRQYINSSWASYILGYARTNDEGKIKGELGIEAYYNDILEGKDGFVEYQQDAYGYKMGNAENRVLAVSGSDIYLTIDSDIQNVLENAIANFSKSGSLDWAMLTVMNAKTGEIVGSATNPNFNPNNLVGLNSYLTPLVGYQYEPGSTMKIFSWMAAMENGIYKGDELYPSGIKVLSDGTKIKDFNDVGWGNINYDTGFAYSSNVGATNLALTLGSSKLIDFYNKMGFGEKTGLPLPGEEAGLIDFYYESELANASFGQGVLITPVQMLQALTSIANDGVMLRPQLVSKIVDSNGKTTYSFEREEVGEVIKKETADKMKELMHKVVYDSFDYNREYIPNGLSLIGKTGTAQIASPNGGYYTGYYDYIRSFAGMFPYEDPQYIIYFATKKYTGNDYVKIVAKTVEDIARVTNLSESKNDVDTKKIVSIPEYINKQVETAVLDIQKKNLKGIVLGDGKVVINQYPSSNTKTIDTSKIFIMTNGKEIKMPDVVGWSTNEIIAFCNFIGLKYKINGFGKVKTTNIVKDTVINVANMTLEITLE